MPDHRAEHPADPPPRKSQRAPADAPAQPVDPPRRSRRVTTSPPAGSDPTPIAESPRHRASENDERLRADKPPHWG